MADALDALKRVAPVMTDPWYLVDAQDRIVDFNAAFFALFPRSVSRSLKGLHCREALALPPCAGEGCLRRSCGKSGSLRLDELDVPLGDQTLRLVVTAMAVELPGGDTGALIVLRDMTDMAGMQQRYQKLMDEVEHERAGLRAQLDERTRELLAANEELNRLERELAALRRGGL